MDIAISSSREVWCFIFHNLSVQLLSHVFDNHVMDLLLWYIDLHQNTDVRLAFEALKVTINILFMHPRSPLGGANAYMFYRCFFLFFLSFATR